MMHIPMKQERFQWNDEGVFLFRSALVCLKVIVDEDLMAQCSHCNPRGDCLHGWVDDTSMRSS